MMRDQPAVAGAELQRELVRIYHQYRLGDAKQRAALGDEAAFPSIVVSAGLVARASGE